jgi:hypothetical protein
MSFPDKPLSHLGGSNGACFFHLDLRSKRIDEAGAEKEVVFDKLKITYTSPVVLGLP